MAAHKRTEPQKHADTKTLRPKLPQTLSQHWHKVEFKFQLWCKFWFWDCGHKLSQTKSSIPFRAKRATCWWGRRRWSRGCGCGPSRRPQTARQERQPQRLRCTGSGSVALAGAWLLGLSVGLVSSESQFHFKLKSKDERAETNTQKPRRMKPKVKQNERNQEIEYASMFLMMRM